MIADEESKSKERCAAPNLAIKLRPLDRTNPIELYHMVQNAGWPLLPRDCTFLQTSPDVEAFGVYAAPYEKVKDSVKIGKLGTGEELLIGSTIVSFYGSYTTIGLVIVSDPFRQRGIATKLMEHALAISKNPPQPRSDQPKASFLTTTAMGEPLYRTLGFNTIGRGHLVRKSLSNIGKSPTSPPLGMHFISIFLSDTITGKKKEGLPKKVSYLDIWSAALRMSDSATRSSRARITTGYLAESCIHFMLQGTTVRAWCSVRACSRSDRMVNPLIAYNADEALSLLNYAIQAQVPLEKKENRHLIPVNESLAQQGIQVPLDLRAGDSENIESSLLANDFQPLLPLTILKHDHHVFNKEASTKEDSFSNNKESQAPAQYAFLDVALM